MPTTVETVLQGFSLASNQGSFAFCGITLLRGTKTTLVDTGHVGRRTLLLDKLKAMGLTPDGVDQVVLTHAHWDHSLNLDVFPNAQVLIHPAEREYVRNPKASDYATPRYVTQMLESAKLREVTEGEEIDDGVRVLATPGHSKGSMSLLVSGAAATTIAVSGDALPNSLSVSSGMPRLVFGEVEDAKRSIAKLLEQAGIFYPGHDRPFEVDGDRIRYLQPTDVRIFGWPTPGEGEGGSGVSYGLEGPFETTVVR